MALAVNCQESFAGALFNLVSVIRNALDLI